MKTQIIFLTLSAILFFNCSKHQYIYFSPTPDSGQESLAIVNDTLEIEYNFNGNNCPVNITIFNKSERPIYVDWKKSVAIIDQKKVDYYIPGSTFEGAIYYYGDFDGRIIDEDRITFIPAKTKYRSTRTRLCDYFEDLPRPKKVGIVLNEESVNADLYQFIPEISPLKFKSFITLSSNESFENEIRYTSEFYISDIVESYYRSGSLNPALLSNPLTQSKGSRSNASSTTGFTRVMTWVIIIPSFVWLISNADEE